MLNDLLTLKKIKGGDIKAFESLFKAWYTPLCLFAISVTGRQDVSEEIVQDVFYIFWKDREKIEILHSIKNYLYKSVRNRSLHYCEHMEVRERYKETILRKESETEKNNDPHDSMEYEELKELIDQTLQRFPERRRQIFSMHRFEGLKYAEIAVVLMISVKTVEAEMTKALHTLREEVENYIQTK